MTKNREVRVGEYQRGGSRVSGHQREVALKTIQFTCECCGQTMFVTQYPGRIPKYCLRCRCAVKREQTAERMRRKRARDQEPPSKVGWGMP